MITAPSIFIFAASLAMPVASDSCLDQATAKKLAGAAQTSFITKCLKDSPSCTERSAAAKLAGAAAKSFATKCAKDAEQACRLDSISKEASGAALEAHVGKCVKEEVGDDK